MRIVLNADDFGHCEDTTRATIECFAAGALTSASFMVKMPATAQALSFARQHPQFSYGVHLTFCTDDMERPVSAPADIPDLLAAPVPATPADVPFLDSNEVRVRALLRRLPVSQIEREMAAQIAVLRDHGVPVSHVDSHGHLHKFAPFRAALSRVLPRFGMARVRTVQDVYLRRPLRSPTYWLGGFWRLALLLRRFRSTRHFYMPASAGDRDWSQALLQTVPAAADTLEIGVHPGYAEPWRAQERLEVQAFATRAKQAGHQLIGWMEV